MKDNLKGYCEDLRVLEKEMQENIRKRKCMDLMMWYEQTIPDTSAREDNGWSYCAIWGLGLIGLASVKKQTAVNQAFGLKIRERYRNFSYL